MIKANELRIGNWVEDEVLGWIRVVGIHTDDVRVIFNHMTAERVIEVHSREIKTSELKPIPLTPEILEKCGFTNTSVKNPFFDMFDISVPFKRALSVNNPGTPNEFVFFAESDGSNSREVVTIRNFDYHGKTYLHQLQNLYFALTGTELEVKL